MKRKQFYSDWRERIALAFVLASFGFGQSTLIGDIDKMRQASSQRMKFEGLAFVGSAESVHGHQLGLSYGGSVPEYVLRGVLVASNKPVVVPLGEVERIEFLEKAGGQARVRLTRVTISSSDLSSGAKYARVTQSRRTEEVLLTLSNGSGDLWWMGSDVPFGTMARLGRVEKTEPGRTIVLTLPPDVRWWAVRSVLNDPTCPCHDDGLGDALGQTVLQEPAREGSRSK